MKKRVSFSVFYNYLLSYVGIAVFFCALIGIYLFNFFVSGYNASVLANEQKKAETAVQDLSVQVSLMSKVAYSVANDMAYSYNELCNDNYNEFKMLQELIRYANGSSLTQRYFLYYHQKDRIYSPSFSASGKGSVYNDILFSHQMIGIEDSAAFYGQLDAMKRNTIVQLPGDGRLLFCFPIQIKSSTINATLCFVVESTEILDRIEVASGGLRNFCVWYEDILLAEKPVGSEEQGELVSVSAANSVFRLTMQVNPSAYMSQLLSYRRITLFCLVICAAILAAGVVVAYFHYKPIRRIKQQLELDHRHSANEMAAIAQRLQDILHHDNEQKALFTNQLSLLRAQAIHLLLCGEYNDILREMSARLNITVENGHSGVIVLRFPERLEDARIEDLMARIEDLSMEQLSFYCAKDPRTGDIDIIVYLPAVQEVGKKDALDLLRELLDAEGLTAQIGDGWVYPDPHKLAASFAEACDELLKGKATAFNMANVNEQRYFEKIIGAIRLGETEEAKTIFEEFRQENEGLLASMMMQRYLLGELLNLLVRAAQDMHILIPPQQISVVLTVQNLNGACDGMLDIIDYIGAHLRLAESTDEKLINRVVDYVKLHYTENDLSLDRLATEFNVSAGYLSHLFRISLGTKYKDYVLRLRMDYARECLRQGRSVADTSQACGYANISHFIKTFKLFSGVTPSAYQKGDQPLPAAEDLPEEE